MAAELLEKCVSLAHFLATKSNTFYFSVNAGTFKFAVNYGYSKYSDVVKNKKKKYKSPSTKRRNDLRLEAFKAKKRTAKGGCS